MQLKVTREFCKTNRFVK